MYGGQTSYGVAGSMPMYADHQYGGMPSFAAMTPQQMVHAIPIGYSGGPQQAAFPSQQGNLMAMPPAPPSFIQSDPTVLHDRYVDPGLAYQGDIDLRVGNAGGAAGRAIYMQQAPPPPQQARVGPHHHLMPAPAPPGTIYSGAGGPMYLAAHPGEAAYPAPPPPQAGVGQGPRGKAMGHMRGMHPQHHQQLAMPHPQPQPPPPQQQQQQPQKRRTQRGMEDNIKRTVYVSYIDLQVTEEQLAMSFSECGTVVDCRICGDPNSAMRFAFIEFSTIAEAQRAQSKSGMVLGNSPLRVLPSKTAIVPVSRELMPRSNDEVERCSRTVYVANIDKKVDRGDVRSFFEGLCGPVSKLRLLGDYAHSTRISFIEFQFADSAMAALNCSGALLGSLPIRVSPSKTPVRSEASHKDRRGGNQQQQLQQQQQQQQQQQRLLMGPHGSSAGGSQHDDDDALYAAEQEQLMAMHLAQTAGAPADSMQLLEATLVQQQQDQQQQQQQQVQVQHQLASLSTPAASSGMLMQAPPSPPLAATAPPLLAAAQPPLPQPAPQLQQAAQEDASAALYAAKYPVIRGRAHQSSPAVGASRPIAQPVAAAGNSQATVLPAALLPSSVPASAAAGTAGVAAPAVSRASTPATVVLQASQPPPAAAVVVPADADALVSQLSQLQVQKQQQQPPPPATTALDGAAREAVSGVVAPPPAVPVTATAPLAAAPVGLQASQPVASGASSPLDTLVAAGLPVPLPLPSDAALETARAGAAPAPVPAPAPATGNTGDALDAVAAVPAAAASPKATGAVAAGQPAIAMTAQGGGVQAPDAAAVVEAAAAAAAVPPAVQVEAGASAAPAAPVLGTESAAALPQPADAPRPAAPPSPALSTASQEEPPPLA